MLTKREKGNTMPIVIEHNSNREVYVTQNEFEQIESGEATLYTCIPDRHFEAIAERASINEIIHFANTVREAGGGDIIDELLISYPEDSSSCLLANALNFNCCVQRNNYIWQMEVDSEELAENIANAIETSYSSSNGIDKEFCVELPYEIGMVAQAFDSYRDVELEKFNKFSDPDKYSI
jgi:hypothetical protein